MLIDLIGLIVFAFLNGHVCTNSEKMSITTKTYYALYLDLGGNLKKITDICSLGLESHNN